MILDDVETVMPKVQVGAAANGESRILLKTLRDGARAGLSSGLIRRGSRAFGEYRTRPQLQVTDRADPTRTRAHRPGKRVGGIPSPEYRVRLSQLADQMLTIVNADARLVRFKGIQQPYCECLCHASGDLSPV
jgi:hypothetical protein